MKHCAAVLAIIFCLAPTAPAKADFSHDLYQHVVKELLASSDERRLEYLEQWRELYKEFGIYLKRLWGGDYEYKETHAAEPFIDREAARSLGIDPDAIEEALKETPARWRHNIFSIHFSAIPAKIHPRYGKEVAEKFGYAVAQTFRKIGTRLSYIIFYPYETEEYYPYDAVIQERPLQTWSKEELKRIFHHEIAHPNDWQQPSWPIQERIALAFAILQRVKAKDRFIPQPPARDYIGAIEDKDNRAFELIEKMREYWGELNRYYYQDRAQLPLADLRIVERHRK